MKAKVPIPCCSNLGIVYFLVFLLVVGLVVYMHEPHGGGVFGDNALVRRLTDWLDIRPVLHDISSIIGGGSGSNREGLKNKNAKDPEKEQAKQAQAKRAEKGEKAEKEQAQTQWTKRADGDDDDDDDDGDDDDDDKDGDAGGGTANERSRERERTVEEWDEYKRPGHGRRSTFDVHYEPFNAKYMNLYDSITFSNKKFDYETMIIMKYMKKARMFSSINVLDVGCGTGMHVAFLKNQGYDVVGLDKSSDAVDYCKRVHDQHADSFRVGDAMRVTQFKDDAFSHILCLNSTIYYMDNVPQFLKNCWMWLNADGLLFLHLVDDIELRYYDTNGWVKLKNGIKYKSTYDVQGKRIMFNEKIKDSGDNVLANQHTLYNVGDTQMILKAATKRGFVVLRKYSLKKSGFRHHYIYVLQK